MISTEVQRTLVKSPPELWAELSDPEALARHLGALGEIRITRVQPEEKVEWEADGASGTITIKPSGWGTKVTLSATRVQAAAEGPATAEETTAEAAEQPATPALEPVPTGEEHAADEPAPAEPDPAPAGEVTIAERFAPEDAPPLLHAPAVAGPEVQQTAEPAALEFDQSPAPEMELAATTPVHEGLAEPEPLQPVDPEHLAEEEVLVGPEPLAEEELVAEPEPLAEELPPAIAFHPEAAPGEESRRGFFSRLVDRFRRPREAPVDDPAGELYEPDVAEPAGGIGRSPSEGATYAGRSREQFLEESDGEPVAGLEYLEPAAELHQAPAAGAGDPATAEHVAEAAPRAFAPAESYEAAAGIEPVAGAPVDDSSDQQAADEPVAAAPSSEPDAEHVADEPFAEHAADEPFMEQVADEAVTEAAQTPAGQVAGIEPPPAGPEPVAEDAQAPPPAGLGEELRAAEESGDEHVQAVLTATLDRLGAAHHRPFSRA